jgi:hypothetical protein
MLPSGEDQPATRIILGTSTTPATADVALPPGDRGHACPKCNGRGDVLNRLSIYAHVDYYRCTNCLHVWTYEIGDADSTVDVTVRMDDKAS